MLPPMDPRDTRALVHIKKMLPFYTLNGGFPRRTRIGDSFIFDFCTYVRRYY